MPLRILCSQTQNCFQGWLHSIRNLFTIVLLLPLFHSAGTESPSLVQLNFQTGSRFERRELLHELWTCKNIAQTCSWLRCGAWKAFQFATKDSEFESDPMSRLQVNMERAVQVNKSAHKARDLLIFIIFSADDVVREVKIVSHRSPPSATSNDEKKTRPDSWSS